MRIPARIRARWQHRGIIGWLPAGNRPSCRDDRDGYAYFEDLRSEPAPAATPEKLAGILARAHAAEKKEAAR